MFHWLCWIDKLSNFLPGEYNLISYSLIVSKFPPIIGPDHCIAKVSPTDYPNSVARINRVHLISQSTILFCSTVQMRLLRVDQWAIGFLDHLTCTQFSRTSAKPIGVTGIEVPPVQMPPSAYLKKNLTNLWNFVTENKRNVTNESLFWLILHATRTYFKAQDYTKVMNRKWSSVAGSNDRSTDFSHFYDSDRSMNRDQLIRSLELSHDDYCPFAAVLIRPPRFYSLKLRSSWRQNKWTSKNEDGPVVENATTLRKMKIKIVDKLYTKTRLGNSDHH